MVSNRPRTVRILALSAVAFLALSIDSHAELIMNEALANEPGGRVSAEWVEIVNWPETGHEIFNLNGYRIIDGSDTTLIDQDIPLDPGAYAVCVRQLIGDDGFESVFGDSSGVWGDVETESYPVIEVDIGLRNSSDTVTLLSPQDLSSTIFWTSSSKDRISLERIRPDGPDDADNFADCVDPSGSTPGRENSVLPSRGDLSFGSLQIAPDTLRWSEPVYVELTVGNIGFGTANDIRVYLYRDLNQNAPETSLDLITSWTITSIPEGGLAVLDYAWNTAPPGRSILAAYFGSANDTSLNALRPSITVRFSEPLLIISEYLANPTPAGPGEWVEISNQAGFPIDMSGMALGDSSGTPVSIPPFAGRMPPDGLWVLAQDELTFRSYYPDFDGVLFELSVWKELNNTSDRIRLVGAAGEIIDSTSYTELYDDNRSVERISLSTEYAKPDDWTGSVDPSGATPGRANSVNRESAGRLAISVKPNPLYLQSGATMVIDYRLDVGESLTMKVFDRSGQPVRTLIDNSPAATGLFQWDGTDDSGQTVHPGAYILWAKSEPSGREQKMMIVIAP